MRCRLLKTSEAAVSDNAMNYNLSDRESWSFSDKYVPVC